MIYVFENIALAAVWRIDCRGRAWELGGYGRRSRRRWRWIAQGESSGDGRRWPDPDEVTVGVGWETHLLLEADDGWGSLMGGQWNQAPMPGGCVVQAGHESAGWSLMSHWLRQRGDPGSFQPGMRTEPLSLKMAFSSNAQGRLPGQ